MSFCGAEGSVREKSPFLLLPEMLGYGDKRSYLPSESFTFVISNTHSSTDAHLTPEDTQAWGESMICQATSLGCQDLNPDLPGSKGCMLLTLSPPCLVSEKSSLKADFISRVTLSLHV